MSIPRQIIPGNTYLLTRRCTQRQFLLRPCRFTNEMFLYLVLWAARRLSIELHAFCVMSNHWHCVFTDPKGHAPMFAELVHLFSAKVLNMYLDHEENVWAGEALSLIPLESKEDILDKIAYTLANPVAAGLVTHGQLWPGLRIGPEQLKAPLTGYRPRIFFREEGLMPKEVTASLAVPTSWAHQDDYVIDVRNLVEHKENEARMEHRRQGRQFLGRRGVLKQRCTDSARSTEARRSLHPRVAAKNKWLRIEAIRRLKAFVDAYREAYCLWAQGVRDAIFPYGTYALRRHSAVLCAPPPD